jgi:hypothetical protein
MIFPVGSLQLLTKKKQRKLSLKFILFILFFRLFIILKLQKIKYNYYERLI